MLQSKAERSLLPLLSFDSLPACPYHYNADGQQQSSNDTKDILFYPECMDAAVK